MSDGSGPLRERFNFLSPKPLWATSESPAELVGPRSSRSNLLDDADVGLMSKSSSLLLPEIWFSLCVNDPKIRSLATSYRASRSCSVSSAVVCRFVGEVEDDGKGRLRMWTVGGWLKGRLLPEENPRDMITEGIGLDSLVLLQHDRFC